MQDPLFAQFFFPIQAQLFPYFLQEGTWKPALVHNY